MSATETCMEYCCHAVLLNKSTPRACHVWASATSCYLEMLDQLQEQICRAADFSFAAFIESLADRQNDANLSVFYRCYFGRCSFELVKLVRLSYTRGRSTCILID